MKSLSSTFLLNHAKPSAKAVNRELIGILESYAVSTIYPTYNRLFKWETLGIQKAVAVIYFLTISPY